VIATGGGRLGGTWIVASGKGGAGTSTVAGLLSYAASRNGASVLLIDGDVQFGVQHLLFGVAAAQGLSSLRRGQADALALPVPVTDGLMILCGGPTADEPPPAGAELNATFRRISPLLRSFGACLIDAGSRHATVAAALGAAEAGPVSGAGEGRLLVVSRSDRIAIAATYALIKAAWDRHPDLPVSVVVNATTPAGAQVVFQSLSTACTRFLGRSLAFAGAIPEDPMVRERLERGLSLHDDEPEGPAHEAAQFVENRIRTQNVPVATGAYQRMWRM